MFTCLFTFVCLPYLQVATNIGLNWGGKQTKLRDSTVLPGVLGEFAVPAKMHYVPRQGTGEWEHGPKWVKERCRGSRMKNMALKPGQQISNVFGPNDPPPWYDLNAQRFPHTRIDDEILKETSRRETVRWKCLEKKQLDDPLTVLTLQE